MQQGSVKLSSKGPQLQLVKRSSTNQMTTVPRTQSITAPKPVIKFTPGKYHFFHLVLTYRSGYQFKYKTLVVTFLHLLLIS